MALERSVARDRRTRRSGGASARTNAAEHKVSEANTLLLHAVKEAASPSEIHGEQAESKKHNQPTRAGTDDQNDAKSQ